MQHKTLLAAASMAAIAVVGCEAGGFVTSSELEVPVHVSVAGVIAEVAGVSLEVTGPGIHQAIIANLPIAGGTAVGTVAVPAGSSRAFLLRAFDRQGIETHSGVDTIDVSGTDITTLHVSLAPLVGSVDVDGRIGEFTLVISPPTTAIGAGQTVQLNVTVTDAYGNSVTDAQTVWGSSNPAVASVTSGGLVEGLVAGTTTIGVSYMGFSGILTVTVQ